MKRNTQLLIGAGIIIGIAFWQWRNRPVQVKVVTGKTNVAAQTNPSDNFFAPYSVDKPTTAVITVPANQVEDTMVASFNLLASFQQPDMPWNITSPANLTGIGNNLAV